MRGKAFFSVWFFPKLRITPAYAGKSNDLKTDIVIGEDHPRVCGEKMMPSM